MIKIAIITKSDQDRQTMLHLLVSQKDFDVFCAGNDSYDAVQSATILRPDIIIMDFQMEHTNGAEIAPVIKRQSPSTALIIVGSLGEQEQICKSFRAEISGYLLKEVDMNKLASSVRIVSTGGYFISTPIVNRIFCGCSVMSGALASAAGAGNIHEGFSPVGRQILEGIAKGYSDREIAQHLCISNGTVRNYLSTVKRKIGLRNRTQIVLYALMFRRIRTGKIKKQILEQG